MNYKLLKSWIFLNKYFLIIYVGCCVFLSLYKTKSSQVLFNLLVGLFTMIITSLTGYFVHMVSHNISFYDLMYVPAEKYLHPLFKYILRKLVFFADFHDIIHHDSNINKKPINLVIEGLQNIYTQGLFLMLINFVFFNNILNNYIILMWGLTYTTLHLINFNIYVSKNHEKHHENPQINFELYLFDILFNTIDEDVDYVEDMNILSVNVTLITILLLIYIKYKNRM